MWKIGKYWINPRTITYVTAHQATGALVVHFTVPGNLSYASLTFEGEDRAELLAALARHTTVFPSVADDDEPPF